MEEGVIKRLNQRGYGFIGREGEAKDLFFHSNSLVGVEFSDLKEGDKVSVVREMSMPANFPKRFQGRTGIVEGRRGRAYIVLIKDNDKGKKFLIQPIHLIKIKQ